jgi:S-DNA-T family DNA segregation ATPase FtsK/SpoIIIE
VIALCPRVSPLRTLAELPGVAAVLSGADLAGALRDAIEQVAGPVAVAVDDAELLGDSPVADLLEELTRTARDQGSIVVAAGTTEDLIGHRYRGWLALIRRSRCGLLLNPSSHIDGEVFDLRLPRSTCGGWPPGRALLVRQGATTPVQVPLPTTAPMAEPAGRHAGTGHGSRDGG